MGDDFLRAVVSFFAIIDPVGNLLFFAVIVEGIGRRERAVAAGLAVGVAMALLAVFAVAGNDVLDFLNISSASFRIAAGALLALPAIRLVEQGSPLHARLGSPGRAREAAVVPLATPLLAGPGALAAATSFAERFGRGVTVGAAGTVLAVTLAAFLGTAVLQRWIPEGVLRTATRIVGVLLAAIAVDFIVTGIQDV